MPLKLLSFPVLISGTEWVDPEDPTVIAETELLGAAASIEAAAKKLEQLKPRAKPKVSINLAHFFFEGNTVEMQINRALHYCCCLKYWDEQSVFTSFSADVR